MKLLIKAGLVSTLLSASTAFGQMSLDRVDGVVMMPSGFLGGKSGGEDIGVVRMGGSGLKGAKKIAISVFNVAFPSENKLLAATEGRSSLTMTTSSAKSYTDTAMTGVDQATQQAITDKAYALFVGQLASAGYEVVDQTELARLAPDYGQWVALPNFSAGRYGAYVAPTGRQVFFLKGDSEKRNMSSYTEVVTAAWRTRDTGSGEVGSAKLASAAPFGVLAVTLVVDYGVYTSTGFTTKNRGSAATGFKPSVTIGAGVQADSGSLVKYWPPAYPIATEIHLQRPVRSERPFAVITGMDAPVADVKGMAISDIKLAADPAKFAAAAEEVLAIAIPKLVNAMVAER